METRFPKEGWYSRSRMIQVILIWQTSLSGSNLQSPSAIKHRLRCNSRLKKWKLAEYAPRSVLVPWYYTNRFHNSLLIAWFKCSAIRVAHRHQIIKLILFQAYTIDTIWEFTGESHPVTRRRRHCVIQGPRCYCRTPKGRYKLTAYDRA
jgi:hypothetical protein